jgi:dihydroorotate dehydrogenase (NAD+) catalytic subunit
VPVIGCGGISTAGDVVEMMMAGASAVEIGSAVLEDTSVFAKIAGDLYTADGKEIGEIVGCAHG